jgi:hypothetical protein
VVALAAGYLTAGVEAPAGGAASAAAGPPAPVVVRGTVESVAGDTLTLRTDAGPVTIRLAATAVVEAQGPTALGALRPGDLVNIGGVRHAQTIFAITGVVVIPAELAGGPSR